MWSSRFASSTSRYLARQRPAGDDENVLRLDATRPSPLEGEGGCGATRERGRPAEDAADAVEHPTEMAQNFFFA